MSLNNICVLAAGRGIGIDGFHKLNLASRATGETILERYQRQLGEDLHLIIGYKAAELMSLNPRFNYTYNAR